MSMKTWKEEFYPVPASKKMGVLSAIRHSIRKWEGLLPMNLKKHNVNMKGHLLRENDDPQIIGLRIDSNSCALCHKYVIPNQSCDGCPLFIVLGNKPCDGYGMPYSVAIGSLGFTTSPVPMIKALKKAEKEFS